MSYELLELQSTLLEHIKETSHRPWHNTSPTWITTRLGNGRAVHLATVDQEVIILTLMRQPGPAQPDDNYIHKRPRTNSKDRSNSI